MTQATRGRPGVAGGCLLCCGPVDPAEPRCPAFALAGITAHAGCCGGTTSPARPEPAADGPREAA